MKQKHNHTYDCEECGKSFSKKIDCRMHTKTHNSVKPYHCQPCDSKFSLKSQFDRHIATYHTNHYVCNLCQEKFVSRTLYLRHQSAHKKEHTYDDKCCETCKKIFALEVLMGSLEKEVVSLKHSLN